MQDFWQELYPTEEYEIPPSEETARVKKVA